MTAWMDCISTVVEKLMAGKSKPQIGTPIEESDQSYQFMYGMLYIYIFYISLIFLIFL